MEVKNITPVVEELFQLTVSRKELIRIKMSLRLRGLSASETSPAKEGCLELAHQLEDLM